jgi:hypothetical protein
VSARGRLPPASRPAQRTLPILLMHLLTPDLDKS